MIREAPPAFVARLRAAFPDFLDLRYNTAVHRWEYVSLSSANKPVSQFWGWFRNSLTGAPIEPDPITGLVPFRDLDLTAQEELFQNLEKSFIGNRQDGPGSQAKKQAQARTHNNALVLKKRKDRAETLAGLLAEMSTGRDWVTDHPHAKDPRRVRREARA